METKDSINPMEWARDFCKANAGLDEKYMATWFQLAINAGVAHGRGFEQMKQMEEKKTVIPEGVRLEGKTTIDLHLSKDQIERIITSQELREACCKPACAHDFVKYSLIPWDKNIPGMYETVYKCSKCGIIK